jgi:hypothetical protein
MDEFMMKHGFWVIVVGLPVIGWIVTELASNWRKARTHEQLIALKQSMVQRGMSADEIERVLQAGMLRRAPAETCGKPAGHVAERTSDGCA